jgi:DNA-binding response OmpR family regulator
MLSVLVRHKGRIVSREELGQAINMESSGGTFSAYLSDLKQAGLIVVDRNGVRANEETLLL